MTRFSGSITALVTPFKDGAVDEAAFRAFINWQIEQGTHGVVPVGTTGESPTLSHKEHDRVIEICVDEVKGRVPVIAGAGSNNTTEAIALVQYAEKIGADAVLVVTPYYNKPNQRGLYMHFAAVAKATRCPAWQARMPRPIDRWVLPVPGGPRKTTFSRPVTKSRVPRCAIWSRLSERWCS